MGEKNAKNRSRGGVETEGETEKVRGRRKYKIRPRERGVSGREM